MKPAFLLSALSASVLLCFDTHAADTATLTVNGVIRPTACSPALSGNGVVDYGTIDAARLHADQPNLLEGRSVGFTVTCSGPAIIALRLVDNRADSVVPGLAPTIPPRYLYGLGAADDVNIGAYTVSITGNSVTGIQASGEAISAVNVLNGNGNSWSPAGGTYFDPRGADWKSFTSTKYSETPTPRAYMSLTGNLGVITMIDQGSHLPLQQEIRLNGSATLELIYL